MSMRPYVLQTAGVAFSTLDLNQFVGQHPELHHPEKNNMIFNLYSRLDNDKTLFCINPDVDAQIFQIKKDGKLGPALDERISNYEYIGSLERAPSYFSAAYSSMEELIAELKAKFGHYFAEDFPWEDRIVEYIGAELG